MLATVGDVERTGAQRASSAERRNGDRFGLDRAGFRVWVGGRGIEAGLVDFSARGLGLLLPTVAAPFEERSLALVLEQGGRSFAHVNFEVANATPLGGGCRVGGRIAAVRPVVHGIVRAPREGDDVELRIPSIVTEVIGALCERRLPGWLLGPGGVRLGARVVGAAAAGVALDVPPGLASALRGAEVGLLFALHGAAFVLRGTLRERVPGTFVVEEPLRLHSRALRRSERVVLSRGQGLASWAHPLVPGARVVAEVSDVSAEGICVRLPEAPASFPPPPDESILLQIGGASLTVSAEVRSVVSDEDNGLVLGMRLVPSNESETLRMARVAERLRYPDLRPRASVSRVSVMGLMEASGYLDLRPATIAPWLDADDERLSVDAVQVDDAGGALGHLSCTRIYEKTWIYHQLATLRGAPSVMDARRALYLNATAWAALLSAGEGYSMAYYDRGKAWHQKYFETFVEWVGSERLAVVTPLDRFEGGEVTAAPPAPGAQVRRIAEADAHTAAQIVRRALPPIVVEAMNLDAATLDTPRLCSAHLEAGLVRAREAWALVEHGTLVAVALCEIGSPSLSLFNILNMAQIFTTPAASPAGQAQLLAAVRDLYSTRGLGSPLIVAPPGTLTGAAAAGLTLAETMGCIVISAEGLRQYRNFLHFALGRFARDAR